MPDDSVEGVSNQVRSAMGVVESALASLNQKLKSSIGPDGVFSLADRALGNMAKAMLGPIGVAAGFIGAAKAMESFAVSVVRLTDFARDTGFARERVVELQGAMRIMGKDTQGTISSISNLGNTFQNLAVFKEGSDFWQSLSKFSGRGAEVATQIMKIAEAGMKVGDQTETVKKFLEVFNSQPEGTKFAIAQALKESVSSLEKLGPALDLYIEKTKNLPPPLSPEKAEQFQRDMSLWGITIDRIWEHMAAQGITVANELSGDFEKVGITSKTVAGALVSFVNEGGTAIRTTLNEINALIAAYERLKVMQEGGEKGKKAAVETFGGQPFGSWFDFLNQTPGEVWNKLDKEEKDKTPGWGERMKGWFQKRRMLGDNQLGGGAGSDQFGSATDFSDRRRGRSLLNQTMDNVDNYLENYNEWGWHPTSTLPGSSVASWLHKQGMHNNPMRGQLRGALGLNDPGETAPWESGGEWHPTRTADYSGRRSEDLIEVEKDSSKTLIEIRDSLQRMEIGVGGSGDEGAMFGKGIRGGSMQAGLGGFRRYRGGGSGGLSSADDGVGAGLQGSEFMAARRARFAEEAKDPNTREQLMAMMHSEGTPRQSLESLANRMDYSGRKLTAGLTPAFYGPMRNGKFEAALAEVRNNQALQAKYSRMIDDVLVRGSNEIGGRTDQGMPSDPNGMWGYGTPTWKKIGGNVFTDWGGGPRGHAGAAQYRQMIERGVAGEIAADRARIDQAQAGPDKWSGGINAKVEFLNVPGGVKTSADTDGDIFKQLQISRTKQGGIYNNPTGGYE